MSQPAIESLAVPRSPIHRQPLVAYFSMEIALQPDIPTYSGGLGILAGDTIRAAADLRVPMVGVSLVHRKGYFNQRLDASGWQTEEPATWPVEKFTEEMTARVTVTLEGRPVHIRAWKYKINGLEPGFYVPVYLLDTNLPENRDWDRTLTDSLYGGDQTYRLFQEVILGIGGVRMLRALGYDDIGRFHMNEGHASLLTVELLREQVARANRQYCRAEDVEAVRRKCIFTTHTPVPAGHDQFPMEMVNRLLHMPEILVEMKDLFCVNLAARVLGQHEGATNIEKLFHGENKLNMTFLALNLSHYVNGVAKKHGEVSRLMFAGYKIDAITNGVHVHTWAAPSFQKLFDGHIAGWREDTFMLRYALGIPPQEIWEAHTQAKHQLIEHVRKLTNVALDEKALTIGFARRAAAYKRADLLFHNIDRLKNIASRVGAIQLIYAGKAHPADNGGKELIKRVVQAAPALLPAIKLVYLPNYDMALAQLLTAGVDIWLNTPQPPLEASGTSGMKAAINGVPSLSILDGWWIEGCIEGRTGWAIGERCDLVQQQGGARADCDAESLYDKLEQVVLPQFYRERDRFVDVMRHAIALNGSFFNTQRMVQQYVAKAYFL